MSRVYHYPAHHFSRPERFAYSHLLDIAVLPTLACAYAILIAPLIILSTSADPWALQGNDTISLISKLFWPPMAAIAILLALRHHGRFTSHVVPMHVACLLAYLAFAGTSVLWAFKPGLSFVRFSQQAMIVTAILLPAALAAQSADLMRRLFQCFALAGIINLVFVLNGSTEMVDGTVLGSRGYLTGKNLMGQFAAFTLFLSVNEMRYPGQRRAIGALFAGIGLWLLVSANSKTALGLTLLVPFLAIIALSCARYTRFSVALMLLSLPMSFAIFSALTGFTINRVSYMLFGDQTFTGRTIIWDFAANQIGRRPLLGWGYQSFWLVGPDAPSVLEAPGWVKSMPNAHSGYVDTKLELGHVGYALLVAFLVATLHAIGRVAKLDFGRAVCLLTLALYIIIANFLESTWMRAYDLMWVVFLFVVADASRQSATAPAPINKTTNSNAILAAGPKRWPRMRMRVRRAR